MVAPENKLKVKDELPEIVGLINKDRLEIARFIVCQHVVMNLFFNILEEFGACNYY
jgi:hypothetical protein